MTSLSLSDGGRAEAVREATVGSLLREAAEATPSTVALVEGVAEPARRRRWRYADLLDESERAAQALLGRFDPGERVAVWANNLPEWVILEMAAGIAGVVLVTVNPALRTDELRHVLGHSQAAGVFHLRNYRGTSMADTLDAIRADLPKLRESVLFEDWTAFCSSGSPTERFPMVDSGDPAQIQYTSGTTGLPKGAVLHHRGITNNARLSYVEVLSLQPGDAQVNPMPLFHTAGCVLATLSAVASHGTLVLPPVFDPELVLQLIESERSVLFGGVPTMLHALLGHPQLRKTDLSSVRVALSGGATVAPELVRRIEATLSVPMAIIYAQTESSPGVTMTRLDDTADQRAETVGRPLPATEVRIVDSAGQTVPVGTVGELCTRGYHVMTGYFDDPEGTAATIDPDGWLHTGDLASMDSRGYFRIEGRLTEMIIRGGENIFPKEIEQLLLTHPAVADVAVIGIPDEVWGEQVAAVVRPAGQPAPSIDELFTFCRQHLAAHKAPKLWAFVDQFPLTGSGKVQKFVLRGQLIADDALKAPLGQGPLSAPSGQP
ncbi:MAG: AMP-binding protein [Acidimicrobiales bacterium]